MNIGNSFKLALRGLLINKARSMLALLGIIIGIGAVITITALGEGLRAAATEQVDELGTNLIFIFPHMSDNHRQTAAGRRGQFDPEYFSDREVRAIEAAARVPVMMTGQVMGSTSASVGRTSLIVQTYGVDDNYEAIFGADLEYGRFFTPAELTGGRRVTVLGHKTRNNLFDIEDPTGETINVDGHRFEVIGTLKEQGGGLGENPDESLMVPMRVGQYTLFGMGDKVQFITLQTENLDEIEMLKQDIARGLNRIRRIEESGDENYMIMTQTDALENFGQFVNVLTMVLGGVAAVSLLVGGIGIMNIMLVNVTERTREIGLRKAIGARQVDILFQFLIEAIVLCLIGGVIGMGLGYLGAKGLSILINQALPDASWDPVINMMTVLIAVVFSTMIGVIFGVYPAANAARQDPISALRYE